MPMFIAAILWTGGSIMGIFGFGDQSVGYIAHLSGLFLGILYGMFLRVRRLYRIQKQSSESPLLSEDYIRIWENNNLK
jgi:membrane associated rhomboid family serine protease